MMNTDDQAITTLQLILLIMCVIKLLHNGQRYYFYRKGGEIRASLFKNDATLTHQLVILFSFLVFIQTLMMLYIDGEYIPSILSFALIAIDQPFYYHFLKQNNNIGSCFSGMTICYFIGFYFTCFLITIGHTFLFSIFPYVAKWFLIAFSVSLLPSVVYSFNLNNKPLYQNCRILNEAGQVSYLFYVFGNQDSYFGLQKDEEFLSSYILIWSLLVNNILKAIGIHSLPTVQKRRKNLCMSFSQTKTSKINQQYKFFQTVQIKEQPTPKDKLLLIVISIAMKQNSDQVECPICLQTLLKYTINEGVLKVEKGADELAFTFCHHNFHVSCISGWLEHNHKTCPNCRANLENKRKALEPDEVQVQLVG